MRLWGRLKRMRFRLLFLPAAVIAWLLLRGVLAEHRGVHKQLRYDRSLQAKQGRLEEVVQADLPAEAVPKLLGKEGEGRNTAVSVHSSRTGKLKVCILTADFWGLKAAGGTATAYHLLAAALAKEENLQVTFLQVTKRLRICQEAQTLNKKTGLDFACLSQHHFDPEVAESSPYEAISHAVVDWMTENPNRCDIVHAHEWGGVFADLVMMNHFRQLQPGLRVAIEPHGGHVWSQLGEINRPMDVYALRIDSNERATNALNDMEISPTKYMLGFLRQRGWTLPNTTLVIPNIVPDAEEHALTPIVQKKVWRIAFFGRLEERKGIKLFVEAVDRLQEQYNVAQLSEFEVYIVGPDATIDMMTSKKWLAAHTEDWKVKVHLMVNIKRDEALSIIGMDGILLVLCSYIDNMPYVVAEAAVKAIPFLIFDAGGALELFDHEKFANIVVKQASAADLAAKMDSVLREGSLTTVRLAPAVTNGQQRWLEFHAEFANTVAQNKQEDEALLAAAKKASQPARTVVVKAQQSSLDLWEPICLKGDPTSKEPLLLLPEGYKLAGPDPAAEIGELLQIAEMRNSPVGALTFGIELPNGKVAYPAAPTWIAYAGDHQHCMDDIPIAITTHRFCSAFLGEARVFRYYNSWTLAMLLDHSGSMLHAYPKVFFKTTEFTNAGNANCAGDKIPKKRAHDYSTAASRLFRDAGAMMHGMVLANVQKPLVSLLDDAGTVDAVPAQRHMGWEFGYLDGFANQTREINHLVWETAEENEFGEAVWGCGKLPDSSFVDYPHFKRQLMHPCHHGGAKCCGGKVHAPFALRLTAFFHADQAGLQISYDAFPVCGDGFDFLVTHYPADPALPPEVLINAGYDPVAKTSRPQRQKLEVPINVRPGDQIDFIVDPRHNHDCDGLYIVEAQIWPPLEGQQSQMRRKRKMISVK